MRAETLHQTILLAIIAGLALAIFAALEMVYPSLQSGCNFFSWFSCASVDNSGHTTTLGIPDYAIGIAGFALMLGIDIPLYVTWNRKLLLALLVVAGVGVGLAVYLAVIELAVIGAFCPVCLGTYVADAVVFVAALTLYRRGQGEENEVASARTVSAPDDSDTTTG